MTQSPGMSPRHQEYLREAEKALADPDKTPRQHAAAQRVKAAVLSRNRTGNSSPGDG